MSPAHCVLSSGLAAGYWRIKCACGQVITGPDAATARERYVDHKAEVTAS